MTYTLLPSSEDLVSKLPKVAGVPLIRYINLLSVWGVIIIGFLSSFGTFFNGTTTLATEGARETYLGTVFWSPAVLGLIVLLQFTWSVLQVLPGSVDNAAENKGVGYLYPLQAAFSVAWMFTTVYGLKPLSVVMSIGATLLAAIIYYRLKTNDAKPTWVAYVTHAAFSTTASWLFGDLLVDIWAVSSTAAPEFIPETVSILVLYTAFEAFVGLWSGDAVFTAVGTWFLWTHWCVNSDVAQVGITSFVLAIVLSTATAGVLAHRVWNYCEDCKAEKAAANKAEAKAEA